MNENDGVVINSYQETKVILPPARWGDLTFNELIEQKNLLFSAWEYLADRDSSSKTDFLQYLHDIDNFMNVKFP
jgi:hypothetical protein